MEIYQVVNEQNYPVYEFKNFENAAQEAAMLNECHEDHYFYVEMAKLQDH
jgi:hypothetical protein